MADQDAITLTPELARRFILGRQGLWPGRRWQGLEGARAAMRAVEHLQLDPLIVAARSQDIFLRSRVADYTQGMWETWTYERREFFDWGGWLAVRPMDELPVWRAYMRLSAGQPNWRDFARQHASAIAEMREVLRTRGTVANRDFDSKDRVRHNSYRGRKDSALALYYLWRTGEAMIHHRERFERVYALTEAIAPRELHREVDLREADVFNLRKLVAFYGLHELRRTAFWEYHPWPASEIARWREAEVAEGRLLCVTVEGWKGPFYAPAADAAILADLQAGRVPPAWKPIGPTTREQVALLAPLDIVSARGRALQLFDFDYKWEVYTPASKRRFGYYALPVLFGDRLVARVDVKLDRTTNTLVLPGFWLEDKATGRDPEFIAAMARGIADFKAFLGAERLDARAVLPVALRAAMKR